jgi:hypothetical protein
MWLARRERLLAARVVRIADDAVTPVSGVNRGRRVVGHEVFR